MCVVSNFFIFYCVDVFSTCVFGVGFGFLQLYLLSMMVYFLKFAYV